ncbi:glycosyl hydrolase family 8 [Streptomyces chartreusis]|uniref:glycosyl hydrolase family 8 n=1 Tax=Streptomyces chartreusis TaxID=1969 RepID=UPI00340E7A1E
MTAVDAASAVPAQADPVSPPAVADAVPDLTSANRRAPVSGLPDWSKAGYRGGAALPDASDANPDPACTITAQELASQYGVRADGSDATSGLQRAIDDVRKNCTPNASYTKLSTITLPAGTITVTRQLGLDADYLVLRGAGKDQTTLRFRPDTNTRYDTLTEDGSDWDEDGAVHGPGKGGWTWPGRGLLRVQTRDVAPKYASDHASAPANRKDIFEGSVNQHWASGGPLRAPSATGTNRIQLATNADMSRFKTGGYLWVGAANSRKFYQQQTATDASKYQNLHMRQQIFQITSVDTAGRNITIDKPLEYDLPVNSTSDGSTAIAGTVYPSRVTPLKVVQGVGIEDLSLTQDMAGMPKLGGGTCNLSEADAKNNYGNMAPEYAQHGIVLKWAANVWIRRVGTHMTGSHPIVTESAKNIQVQESTLDGSWNKGKGGNGYFRGSRVWDSLYAYNTTRNLRHFTFQWSASGNVVIGNDFDSDLNLHGGWERRNLFENNRAAVPFEHASKNCRSNCGEEGGDAPDDSTWYPIWWAAGPKALKWSGSSGPQNVFYNNQLSKQRTQGGPYSDYYADRHRLYQFGSAAGDPANFQHLAVSGATIPDWASRETLDYSKAPNAGVNASRTDSTGSLFLKNTGGGGGEADTVAPSRPGSLASTGATSSSVSLSWNASTDNVGVTGYDVLRNGESVGTATGTTYTDTGLAASTAYSYTVRARDAAGNVSAVSNTANATTRPGASGDGPAVPFGSHTIPYADGILQPSGTTPALDQKVIDYYQNWKSAFVRQNCGNGWYQVISPDADHPYVAEAQGYGMVISATMAGADPDAKKIFDGLTKWMIDHPSSINPDLLAAEQDTNCRSVNGGDGATDGDMNVAYGLLLADRQWGSTGTHNYKQLAIKHINAIKQSEINSTTNLLKLGDWTEPGDQYYNISRTSDWMVDHFRAFRKSTGDTAWDTIRTAHQNQITSLQAKYAPSTGLLPDFVVDTATNPRPAPGQVLEDPNDGAYWWNACRTPWRIADDAVTSGDSKSLTAARKLNTWIKGKTGGDPDKIAIGYRLNGTQIDSGSEAAFYAPFAVAATTDPGSQSWLDALWNKMLATPIDTSSYYSASIQLQTMITVSGNHWVP